MSRFWNRSIGEHPPTDLTMTSDSCRGQNGSLFFKKISHLIASEWSNLEVKHKVCVPITTKIPGCFLFFLSLFGGARGGAAARSVFSYGSSSSSGSTSGKTNRWTSREETRKKTLLGVGMEDSDHPAEAAVNNFSAWTSAEPLIHLGLPPCALLAGPAGLGRVKGSRGQGVRVMTR